MPESMPEYILKLLFFPVISKLNFQHRYSSHMIIQKSFKYSDLLLKKHLLLLLLLCCKRLSRIFSGFFEV